VGALAIGDQILLRIRHVVCGRIGGKTFPAPMAKPAAAAPPFRNLLRPGFFKSMGVSFEDRVRWIKVYTADFLAGRGGMPIALRILSNRTCCKMRRAPVGVVTYRAWLAAP